MHLQNYLQKKKLAYFKASARAGMHQNLQTPVCGLETSEIMIQRLCEKYLHFLFIEPYECLLHIQVHF
jgi:hypothetical protein